MNGRRHSASWLRVVGLIRKETREVLRDPGTLSIAIVLPLILLFLFGYGVSFDPRAFTVGLVVENPTPDTGAFESALAASRYFEVETAHDRRQFDRLLAAGKLDAIVLLPDTVSQVAYRGETAPIQVIVDGSEPNTAALVQNYVEQFWVNWNRQESLQHGRALLAAPVELEPRVWFNATLSSRDYLVPGSIAIVLTLIGALLTALVIAREWERGTMEALLATPIAVVELLAGKLAPYFALGMGSMMLSVVVAVVLFGVPMRGSVWLLVLLTAVFMVSALAQGLLISTLTRNQLVAAQTSILSAFLPAFYFSDFVFEVDSMPWPLQLVSYLVPARYLVSSLQSLFLAGDVWSVIAPDLLALTVIAAGLTAITAWTTRTRLQ